MPLVTIDGNGRTDSVAVAGSGLWTAQMDRWNRQPAAWIDARLESQAHSRWDGDEFPRFSPSVWWFGASTPMVVQFLRRWIHPRGRSGPGFERLVVYHGERTSPPLPSMATFPAPDLIVDGDVTYVVLAPAQPRGPWRVVLLAVRRRGIDVLAARAMPALDRVRYARRESALYGLIGNDVVRIRMTSRR